MTGIGSAHAPAFSRGEQVNSYTDFLTAKAQVADETSDTADHAHPPGILSLNPRVLQCEECGVTADAATVGLPKTALKQPQLVHLLSGLRFHAHSWPDGRTDNPRLCRACRLARGCHCWSCDWERRGRR